MNHRLQGITDWPERAAAADWCILTLAKNCAVSVSTLERFFHEAKGKCPGHWIHVERMRWACGLLLVGRNVQETSGDLNYGSQHGFSLAFKQFHG